MEAVQFLSLPLRPRAARARVLYDVAAAHNCFTEQSLYLNIGYWKASPQTLDEACQAMAALVAESAQFTREDRVLDVGFGFADQDLYWMDRFAPAHITGLNITPSQVRFAQERVSERFGPDRVRLVVGSATDMPFAADGFDKVVALESGHHFVTREDFFAEAFRVLRPGGRLAAAEVLAMERRHDHRGVGDRLSEYERHFFAAWPRANWYSGAAYARKLVAAGFERVRVRSIRDEVYPQLMEYLARRLDAAEVKRRVNGLHRRRWRRAVRSSSYRKHTLETFDYVIAVAEKPSARAAGDAIG